MNPWMIAVISWVLNKNEKSAGKKIAQKRAGSVRPARSSAALTRRDRLGSTNVLNKNPMSLFVRGVIVVLLMFAFIFAVIIYSYWVRSLNTSTS